MTIVVSVSPVPFKAVYKARDRLQRLGLTAKITFDGVRTLSVIAPNLTVEETINVLKDALDWDASDWQTVHTKFTASGKEIE